MKILSVSQIREADRFTIQNEPISSVDLMERAAFAIFEAMLSDFGTHAHYHLFCGPGNNGGDALVVARLLNNCSIAATVWLVYNGQTPSPDHQASLLKLQTSHLSDIRIVHQISDITIADSSQEMVVVDALFGSGLSRNLSGLWGDIITKLNEINGAKVAVDIPSGLFADEINNPADIVFKASITYSLQFPKQSFLFFESAPFVGKWKVLPIGLHPSFIQNVITDNQYVTIDFIRKCVKHRSSDAHKGTFGHALLIAGSYGMMGAAVLASKSCMRSGVGLLTTHVPKCGYSILQTSVPEALVDVDKNESVFSEMNLSKLVRYDAVAVGCGISTNPICVAALKNLIESATKPLILDADALNILSENKEWLKLLPENSILTPHPKEFERLTTKVANSKERLDLLRSFASKYKLVVLLKGSNSAIATPNGKVFFNSTGNNGLATAGSGDVLTGIILGLLAQGYSSMHAAILGAYLHGLAADLVVKRYQSEESLVASDIAETLGEAYKWIRGKK